MKPTVRLMIGSDEIAVADWRILLELSACGRGFITADIARDCSGQLVRLDLGINDEVYRWFTGYVERCGPAERGFKRLKVRELVGALQQKTPVSLQHPTLRAVCNAVSVLTGLEFALPSADYVDKPVPHFRNTGGGWSLMDSLGGAFGIADYCWYQLPDGTVFTGSYADSRFAGQPVDVPEEFASAGQGGNSLDMALIPAVRPGVVFNNRRITQVEASTETMTLRWTLMNAAGRPAWDSPEKRQIDKAYPEIAAGLHVPRTARVTGPTDTAALGDIADAFRPRYAVNVQLLDADGNDDGTPEITAVPLPVPMAGPECGFYQYPPEGTLVELGFLSGRQDQPIIRQVMQKGSPLPDISPGEQLQQQRAGVSQRVTVAGNWERETDQRTQEKSRERHVTCETETRETHARTALVSTTDDLTVIGKHQLAAGEIMHLADGPYSVAAAGAVSVTAPTLSEQIAGIRESVAAVQRIMAPSIVLGTDALNLLRLFTDTLDVIEQLAAQTAAHSHPGTGGPTNAAAIAATGTQAAALTRKYNSLIG